MIMVDRDGLACSGNRVVATQVSVLAYYARGMTLPPATIRYGWFRASRSQATTPSILQTRPI